MCVGIIRDNSVVGGRPQAKAQTPATERVTLYCTWRPSALTTRTHAGPRLWNSFPISLRQISSFGQFRRYLKNHLFGIWEITAQCDVWFSALYKYSYLLTYLHGQLATVVHVYYNAVTESRKREVVVNWGMMMMMMSKMWQTAIHSDQSVTLRRLKYRVVLYSNNR